MYLQDNVTMAQLFAISQYMNFQFPVYLAYRHRRI
jgi:hypothetical protein